MQIVLFLGAGFSAAFDFPVMDEFVPFAKSSGKITDDDKKFIDELVLDTRKANSFLQSRPTNLEDILSFAIMGDRIGLLTASNTLRSQRVKTILQKIFSHIPNLDHYWDKFQSFKKFLDFDLNETEHTLSIVTTNYDLSAESALICCGRRANPIFSIKQINEGEYRVVDQLYDSSGVPFFKLHGSINWFEDINDKDAFKVESRVVEVYGHDKRFVSLPLVCSSNFVCKEIPYIIPPSFLKPDFARPMRKIWSSAAKVLGEADLVVFIGYSFPASDVEMRYFLARSLMNNANIQKIFVIDKRANSIVEKLKSSESGFGSHFKDFLEPIEKKWETAKLILS